MLRVRLTSDVGFVLRPSSLCLGRDLEVWRCYRLLPIGGALKSVMFVRPRRYPASAMGRLSCRTNVWWMCASRTHGVCFIDGLEVCTLLYTSPRVHGPLLLVFTSMFVAGEFPMKESDLASFEGRG